MDISPRNSFNCRLSGRWWQIPTDIPKATPYNTPIGTRPCDSLGFMCHPQQYPNIHGGTYPNTDKESTLYSLDYYNPFDTNCCHPQIKEMCPELAEQYRNIGNTCTPKLWRNNTKLWKYNNPS